MTVGLTRERRIRRTELIDEATSAETMERTIVDIACHLPRKRVMNHLDRRSGSLLNLSGPEIVGLDLFFGFLRHRLDATFPLKGLQQ